MHAATQLKGMYIDSVFYIFENFHQNFLEQKHLQGEVNAAIDLTSKFKQDGTWDAPTLQAHMDILLKNGQLNNFTPILHMAKYVDEKALKNLCFAPLHNTITIKNRVIYLPSMEIQSNIARIQMSGQHTFDNQIAYNFAVPFKNLKKKPNNKAFGEMIDQDSEDNYLLLKLKGNTHHYKISYDIEALKGRLRDNLKAQKKILQAILSGTYQKKEKTKELTVDHYFEFD